MKTLKLLMTGAAAVLFLGSCKKSGSDAPTDPTMEFQLKTSNPLVVVNRTDAAGSILWSSGTAMATQVKLEAKKNNSELEFTTSSQQQIDLFASVLTSLGSFIIPAGTYTEVEFKITLNQNGATPSLVLNGQFTSGTAVVTPVVFTLTGLFELKAEQNNVVVTDNTTVSALTTLNLSFVSSGITEAMMSSATITDGKIVISASSNSNLYTIMRNNLQEFHHVDVSHH